MLVLIKSQYSLIISKNIPLSEKYFFFNNNKKKFKLIDQKSTRLFPAIDRVK